MHLILLGIAFFVGIFTGGMLVAWLSIIPSYDVTPTIILSSAGSVIALCALGLTIRQSSVTRKHNKISVTPKMATTSLIHSIENTITLTLMNNGLGPARILSYSFLINKIETIDKEQVLKLLNLSFEDDSPSLQGVALSFAMVNPGKLWASNEKEEVFKLEFIAKPNQTVNIDQYIIKLKASILMKIEYESLYGDKCTEEHTL